MPLIIRFFWLALCVLNGLHFSLCVEWSFGALWSSTIGRETCSEYWTNFNLTHIDKALEARIFGQHIVVKLLPRLLRAHRSLQPRNALAIALHGSTGTGKTFVSQIIAEHMLRLGEKSQYFHRFIAHRHFPLIDDHHILRYKNQLRTWISGNVSLCPNSVFVFEEVEKFPKGLVDEILPFLEPYARIEGVDYRNAVFVFTSNLGKYEIASKVLEHYNTGQQREELSPSVFDRFLSKSSYNEKGGFKHSVLIEKNVIESHLPFLPLERRHVKKCIEIEMKELAGCTATEDKIDAVADEVDYYVGKDTPLSGLFAKHGCKKIKSHVLYHC